MEVFRFEVTKVRPVFFPVTELSESFRPMVFLRFFGDDLPKGIAQRFDDGIPGTDIQLPPITGKYLGSIQDTHRKRWLVYLGEGPYGQEER